EMMIDYDPSGAVRQFDEVVELAQRVGNKGIEAHALASQAVALSRLGEFGRAQEAARRALDAAALSDSAIKIADVDMLVGTAYFDMGRAEEAFELVERGRKLAEDVDGVECACYGWRQQGLMELERSRLPEARSSLSESLRIGVGTAIEPVLHNVRSLLASTEFRHGDKAAVAAIDREIANAEAINDGFGAAYARLELAAAQLELGRAAA